MKQSENHKLSVNLHKINYKRVIQLLPKNFEIHRRFNNLLRSHSRISAIYSILFYLLVKNNDAKFSLETQKNTLSYVQKIVVPRQVTP